jgi:hypothetical protein
MLILLLVSLTAAGIVIGIGAVIGLIVCVLAAILIGLGVISSSVAVGLFSKRLSSGLRAFLIQCTVIASLVTGTGCGLLLHLFFGRASLTEATLCGALGGVAAGLLIAASVDFVLCRLNRWTQEKVQPAVPCRSGRV